MIVGALLCTIGCVLECAASQFWLFLLGRALMGVGQGFALTNIGVYICEIAPSRSRGKFVSLPQFGAAIGVCTGYFTCYGSIHIEGHMSWRLPFVLQALLSTVWAAGSFFLSESPRWLILHGKRDQAMKELENLDFEPAEAEKDVLRPIESAAPGSDIGVLEGLHLIFARQYRSQTLLAVFILSFIQLSGIDGVLYVSHLQPAHTLLLTPFRSTHQQSSLKPASPHKPLPSSHPASPRFSCSFSAFLPLFSQINGAAVHPPSPVASSSPEPCSS